MTEHPAPQPAVEQIRDEADFVPVVRAVWRDILGCEPPDDDTGFFEAGGDSLLLLALVEKLTRASGLPLRTLALYRAATIRKQAALLAELSRDGRGDPGQCM
ncbi:phosphopantetheine-binding protein [Streptomyces sp. NPDC050560]|uniref:phosphopantetheine-binding protein n=1 Tax=Streptomyces sp. NPDC050560 TaxID=3365630 RepID=UPI0037A2B8E3